MAQIGSVASFFVSRIDTAVDNLLDEKIARANDPDEKRRLNALKGKIAIANAKLAYQRYLQLLAGARWQALKSKGAKPQRLLWASTGTKNKAYSDVLYVEELIGPDTVNTMPVATMDAFRDHGKLRDSLEENAAAAQQHARRTRPHRHFTRGRHRRSWSKTACSYSPTPPTNCSPQSPRSEPKSSSSNSTSSNLRSATSLRKK